MERANIEELLYVVEESLVQNGKDISADKVAKLNDQWTRGQITVDALGFELSMILVDAKLAPPVVD
jgi:hypothetical protein